MSRTTARKGGAARFLALLASLAMLVTGLAAVVVAAPASATPSDKVRICHVNAPNGKGSYTNPYQNIYVNDSSVDEFNNPDSKNGHGTHGEEGEVWYPGINKHEESWGDIIPPIGPYENKQGKVISFPGLNWQVPIPGTKLTTEDIWNNDCNIPQSGTSELTCQRWDVDLAGYRKNQSVKVFIDGEQVASGSVDDNGMFSAGGDIDLGGTGTHTLTVTVQNKLVESLTQTVDNCKPGQPSALTTIDCVDGWTLVMTGYPEGTEVEVYLNGDKQGSTETVGADGALNLAGDVEADAENVLTVKIAGEFDESLEKSADCRPDPEAASSLTCANGWSVVMSGQEPGTPVEVFLNDGSVWSGSVDQDGNVDAGDPDSLGSGTWALRVKLDSEFVDALDKTVTCGSPSAEGTLTCAAGLSVELTGYVGSQYRITGIGSDITGDVTESPETLLVSGPLGDGTYNVAVEVREDGQETYTEVFGDSVTCTTPPPPPPPGCTNCDNPPETPEEPFTPTVVEEAQVEEAIVTQANPQAATTPLPAKVAVPASATLPASVPAGEGSGSLPMWALALIAMGAAGAIATGMRMRGARR